MKEKLNTRGKDYVAFMSQTLEHQKLCSIQDFCTPKDGLPFGSDSDSDDCAYHFVSLKLSLKSSGFQNWQMRLHQTKTLSKENN